MNIFEAFHKSNHIKYPFRTHLKYDKIVEIDGEFGISEKTGEIILIDEISQDCIRANDIHTNVPLTKDCYRNMKSDEEVLEAYKEFLYKIEIYPFKAFWSKMPKDY